MPAQCDRLNQYAFPIFAITRQENPSRSRIDNSIRRANLKINFELQYHNASRFIRLVYITMTLKYAFAGAFTHINSPCSTASILLYDIRISPARLRDGGETMGVGGVDRIG